MVGLLPKMGTKFHILGKYKEAEQIGRRTLRLSEKVLDKEHPNTLTSINNLVSA
jgi:hypothetical protein